MSLRRHPLFEKVSEKVNLSLLPIVYVNERRHRE